MREDNETPNSSPIGTNKEILITGFSPNFTMIKIHGYLKQLGIKTKEKRDTLSVEYVGNPDQAKAKIEQAFRNAGYKGLSIYISKK